MGLKCCYYERGSETKYICTTDDSCPNLAGWTLVGSWGVNDCANCFASGEEESESDETSEELLAHRLFPDYEEQIRKAICMAHWIKEHWDEIFGGHPLDEYEKYEDRFLKDTPHPK